MMRRYPYLAMAVLVLLVAAAMRLGGAAHSPFWSDEAWNLWAVQSDFQTDAARLAANHHPPAYFWSLDAWRHLAGESKIALNFVAIAAGMLTCAIVIRAGKDGLGIAGGLAAGLIIATFEQPVYYGQSIRHYSFLLLCAALTLWLLGRALRRPTWPRFIAYGVSVAFTAYSLYIGAFLIVIQAAYGLMFWRAAWRDKAKLIVAYGLALILFAPWLVIGLNGALTKLRNGAITGYLNSLPTTPDGLTAMLDILLGGQVALGIGLIGMAFVYARQKHTAIAPRLYLLQGLAAFGLMVLINLRLGIISERTLAMFAPSVALMLATGLSSLPRSARGWLMGALVAWTILTPQGVLPRLNSDLIAQAVADGYSAGDLVILETGFDDAAFGYQLQATLPPLHRRIFRSYYEYDFPSDDAMMAALDGALATHERVWLVYWNIPPRMADKLAGLGYVRLARTDIPIGSGDPLYERDPIARVSLWVRPPVSTPLIFGDSLRFEGATVAAEMPHDAASIFVDMWWTPMHPIDRDYTVGVFLLDAAGVTRAESFGPPPDNPMTGWRVGQTIPIRHRFTLPPELSAGTYTLLAVVYWYESPDAPLPVNGGRNAVIGQIQRVMGGK